MDFVPWWPVRTNPTMDGAVLRESFFTDASSVHLQQIVRWHGFTTISDLSYLNGVFSYISGPYQNDKMGGIDFAVTLPSPNGYEYELVPSLPRFRELVAKSPKALRVMGLADYMKLTAMVEVRANPHTTPDKERFYVGRDTIELEQKWDRKNSLYKTDTVLTYRNGEFYFHVLYGGQTWRFTSAEFQNVEATALPFSGTRATKPYLGSMLTHLRKLVAKDPKALRVMGLADYMRLESMAT